MGIISKGILGPVLGKVGTVVGSTWNGIAYIRSLPNKSGRSLSPAQLAQAGRFSTAVRFVTILQQLVNEGFATGAGKTARNEAVSYTLRNAITGNYPNFSVDYALALVTKGNLPGVQNAAVAQAANNTLLFSWTDNSGIGSAKATDNAVLVCYCEARQQSLYMPTGFVRSQAQGSLDVSEFAGEQVQTWLSFSKADGSEYANSIYTGAIQL